MRITYMLMAAIGLMLLIAGPCAADQKVIEIDRQGAISIECESRTLKGLIADLMKLSGDQRKALKVVLKADDRVAYRRVREVMDALHTLQITKIMFGRMASKEEAKLAEIDKALAIEPASAKLYVQRAKLRIDIGQIDLALKDLDRALRLDPTLSAAFNQRGLAHARSGRLQAAIADFTRAIELDPSFADAYLNRGTTGSSLKKYRDAIRDYEQALRLKPGLAKAYGCRGRARKALGDMKGALEDYSRALDLDPRLSKEYRDIRTTDHDETPNKAPTSRAGRLRITLTKGKAGMTGTLQVEQRFTGGDQLKALLAGLADRREVVIDAGEDVPFSQVVAVLKLLRAAKIERIVFATRPAEPKLTPTPKQDPENPGLKLNGSVMAIGPGGLVTIDIGKNDGVRAGQVLTVFRGNSYVGQIRVDRVSKDTSSAKPIEQSMSKQMKAGDKVTNRF